MSTSNASLRIARYSHLLSRPSCAEGRWLLRHHRGKRDDQIETPVVVAKSAFAEEMAEASSMKYHLIPGSLAEKDQYEMIWSDDPLDASFDSALFSSGA